MLTIAIDVYNLKIWESKTLVQNELLTLIYSLSEVAQVALHAPELLLLMELKLALPTLLSRLPQEPSGASEVFHFLS
jgi:hypothetical protein